jgi:hypothetical protein
MARSRRAILPIPTIHISGGIIMPDTTTRSITAKIRFPREILATSDYWATAHDMPRSVAVRVLALRGLAFAGPVEPEIIPPEACQ